jgi:hypothetical protein
VSGGPHAADANTIERSAAGVQPKQSAGHMGAEKSPCGAEARTFP